MNRIAKWLLHVGYWFLYLSLLTLFFLLLRFSQNVIDFDTDKLLGWGKLMFGFAIVPGAIGFYSAYLFLFPTYIRHKKIAQVLSVGFLISAGAAVVGSVIIAILISPNFIMVDDGYGLATVSALIAFVTLINATMGMVIRGFVDWHEESSMRQELDKRNHELELALVKLQIDPHFLFNTINNIDVLIAKDAASASAYLNKLSDILRFMLYEAKSTKVPLSLEISNIEKYIELQKIRIAQPSSISFVVNGDTSLWSVEGMLFAPFIENAFKHYATREGSFIDISFQVTAASLFFRCRNSTASAVSVNNHQGLGKELAEKRLQYLYPNQFELTTILENNVYQVQLTIWR